MCLTHIPMKMPLKNLPRPSELRDAVRDEVREEDSSAEEEKNRRRKKRKKTRRMVDVFICLELCWMNLYFELGWMNLWA